MPVWQSNTSEVVRSVRVYREKAFGRTEIGSDENGNVYSGVGYMKKRVGGYNESTIYKHGFSDGCFSARSVESHKPEQKRKQNN